MSEVIRVYLDDATERLMKQIAIELHRSIEELAGTAVAEAAIEYFKSTQTRDQLGGGNAA